MQKDRGNSILQGHRERVSEWLERERKSFWEVWPKYKTPVCLVFIQGKILELEDKVQKDTRVESRKPEHIKKKALSNLPCEISAYSDGTKIRQAFAYPNRTQKD